MSAAGGVDRAPGRARAIGATCLQLFTRAPSRWAGGAVGPSLAEAFRAERAGLGIRVAGAHDSYLVNLATPERSLRQRSYRSFRDEMRRCEALGLDFLVTHPGSATDGDRPSGLHRNADALARALEEVPGGPPVLVELTAGSGNRLGSTFQEIALLLERVPAKLRARLAVCFDTCHAYAAGYDLVGSYDDVFAEFDGTLGLDRLALFHLNDSRAPLGSRVDRHAHIGEGALGRAPFRRLMNDPRFGDVPKLLETPKGDDPVTSDRRNLKRLRSFRRGGVPRAPSRPGRRD